MPTTPEQIDEYFAKLDWPFHADRVRAFIG